jgi:hypothetical protein
MQLGREWEKDIKHTLKISCVWCVQCNIGRYCVYLQEYGHKFPTIFGCSSLGSNYETGQGKGYFISTVSKVKKMVLWWGDGNPSVR